MELIEREGFVAFLQAKFEEIENGEGYCIFISGEAGMGKTSLVKAFCKAHRDDSKIFQGACDALFTPRPLAPLYDILWQVNRETWPDSHNIDERTELFSSFFRELKNLNEKILIVFEDIHWADEATLDFIKFLSRRITQLPCLFILTYRDDGMFSHNAVRNMLGQLPADCFTRLPLTALSKNAVEKLAEKKGYNGEEVYSITGGNPFYVTEILSSYSVGVPDSIKDAILSAYNRTDEKAKQVWDLLSVIPSSFEVKYLEKFEPLFASAIESCLNQQILLIRDGFISFKHELFRRTIESSLSPIKRVALHRKILELLQESFEQQGAIERIIHHAKNANDYDTIVRYAPLAARQAASVGAHAEASRLYLSAIENYQGSDKNLLNQFYQDYAYECYLTNQLNEAITYTGKSIRIWEEKRDFERIGNCMRFMSRLYWLHGNRRSAQKFAEDAIEVFRQQPASPSKAMAYSNMAQLKLLSDEYDDCIIWGKKAIAMASELNDNEALCHALNNVGSVQMNLPASKQEGLELLNQSLDLAHKNAYHEHAARAYSNLAFNGLKAKDYAWTNEVLKEGIQYCEERDLDSWRSNMLTLKAALSLETGNWKEAYEIADNQLKIESSSILVAIGSLIVLAKIKMRRGDGDVLPLLREAEKKAFETKELQSLIPSMIALLEYEWLTGDKVIETENLLYISGMVDKSIYSIEKSEFAYWLLKARGEILKISHVFEGYRTDSIPDAQKAALIWKKLQNPYAEAMLLFEGTEANKREAIGIVQRLAANTACQKMKLLMRTSGIKSIPRGLRKSTQSNPALLTGRELDVLQLLKEGLQNKEIAGRLFISAKTVDHHISSILFKLDTNTRAKAVNEAIRQEIIK